jgi:tRNA nucleotidyltransferase (CCA-adding enzyme)
VARIPKKKRRSRVGLARRVRTMRARASKALPALLRRPGLSALARAAARSGAQVWIVGGAARDLLLGRADPDVDLAVSTDPFALAQELARDGFGTFVPLSDASPRVARLAGRRDIDLAAVEGGGISQDLGRRDFTVNALAIGLAGGDWTDPFGGVEDLARGRLRAISERNLADDPLRILRGARLIATHELDPDAATTAMCRRAAPLLPTAAPERIRAELEKLLAARKVRPALLWAERTGILAAALGGGVSAAAGVRAARQRALDSPSITARTGAERVRLRLALLARALGLDAAAGSAWLAARRFPRSEAREVAALLALVDQARQASGDLAMWRWVRDAGGRAPEALAFASLLDDPPGTTRRALARRVRAARQRKAPRVTGEDIQEWLAIVPGPAVGEALADLEVEGLRGAVRTRAGAREWIRGRWKGGVRTVRDGGKPADRL